LEIPLEHPLELFGHSTGTNLEGSSLGTKHRPGESLDTESTLLGIKLDGSTQGVELGLGNSLGTELGLGEELRQGSRTLKFSLKSLRTPPQFALTDCKDSGDFIIELKMLPDNWS